MRDCVILINDRLVSFTHTTHSSSLNPELLLPPTSPQSSSPIWRSESWSEWSWLSGLFGALGTGQKSLFCLHHCHGTSVHYIFDRGCVRELVDHYRYHVSEGVWVKINFWRLSHPWENLLRTDSSALTNRWQFVFWKTWPPPNLIIDCIKLRMTQSLRTQEHSHHETSYILLTISVSCVVTLKVLSPSQHHLSDGCMSCTKFARCCTEAGELCVIDDCTLFFCHPASYFTDHKTKRSSPKKPVVLKFSSTWHLCHRPWVVMTHSSLYSNSTHDKPALTSTQMIVIYIYGLFVYYESINRELKIRLIYECRCDVKTKD